MQIVTVYIKKHVCVYSNCIYSWNWSALNIELVSIIIIRVYPCINLRLSGKGDGCMHLETLKVPWFYKSTKNDTCDMFWAGDLVIDRLTDFDAPWICCTRCSNRCIYEWRGVYSKAPYPQGEPHAELFALKYSPKIQVLSDFQNFRIFMTTDPSSSIL